MKIPCKTLERKLFADYDYVVGVDEVGMGCLAGPVVVCAVVFEKKFFNKTHRKLHWLRDSKLLQPEQREKFAKELLNETGLRFKISLSHPAMIDKINIYQAARLAMRRAVTKLTMGQRLASRPLLQFVGEESDAKKRPARQSLDTLSQKIVVLVDGPYKINGLSEGITQIPVVGGDRQVFAIACASILAKVYRDKMMIGYAKRFPGYGFEKHKGYGTRLHLEKLAMLGPCPMHRRGFAPVARLL